MRSRRKKNAATPCSRMSHSGVAVGGDQAGPHLQIVHGLDHEGEAGGPIIAPFGEQTDADRIAPGSWDPADGSGL